MLTERDGNLTSIAELSSKGQNLPFYMFQLNSTKMTAVIQ